jgi:methionine synthase / methylenetetrahydrofolate reductase(NADPH)
LRASLRRQAAIGWCKPMNFLDSLLERPLVADGAMGTMINAVGVGFERSFEGLNLQQPDVVLDIHRAFVAAGADVLETNTFSATAVHLERWGLASNTVDINAAGARLARQAAGEADRQVFVAGSVGPTGARLSPLGPLGADEARISYAQQISTLAEAGVDLLVLETFADLAELELAISVARSVCALPIVASMSFTRDVRTLGGIVPDVALRRLRSAGVDVIGANCSTGPRGIFEVINRYAEADDGGSGSPMALAAMPNAGYPESRGERLFFPAPPDYFAEYAHRFLASGARLIGGCCGTTPDHIRGIRPAIDEASAAPRQRLAAQPVQSRQPVTDPVASPERLEPKLARDLRSGRFVTTVEMEPPKSSDTSALQAHALILRDAGATALNISDTPMARMRMTGLAAAVKVQQSTDLETVLHFPVRGRNLLRVQGDLLAAHALDVRTLFVTMGDLASIGDYPQAFDHHDIVPTGLVKLITQQFNAGLDSAGTSIGVPCSFFAGVAVNLTPTDFAAEAKLLRRKISFGAGFALTQPVFDPARAEAFLAFYRDTYGPPMVPLLCGVLPLASVRHAVFLQNEVPGMSLPAHIVTRMERAADDGRSEGRRIAAELLEEMRPFAQGIYFIPSFRRYDVVAELIAGVQP